MQAVLATVLAGLAAQYPGPPHASKTAESLSPGNYSATAITDASLLARHGEWSLAWDAVQDADKHRPDFSATVLTRLRRYSAAESVLAGEKPARGDAVWESVRRARLLADAGRHAEAVAILETVENDTDDDYAPYRDVLLVRERLALDRTEAALVTLEKARISAAGSAVAPWFSVSRVDVLQKLGRSREALDATEEALTAAGDASVRRRLLRARFELALELGERERALAAASRLFDGSARSAEAGECARRLVTAKESASLSDRMLLDCAAVFQVRGSAADLKRALRLLDERALSAAQSEEHRLRWSEYHYLTGDYSRAIVLARPTYAVPDLRRRSMIVLARSFRKVGRPVEAVRLYEAYADEYPNDGLAADALYAAASLLQDSGDQAGSDVLLDRLRRAYPSTFHGWAAAMKRASALEKAGRDSDAAAIYEQWLVRSQRSDEAALFYMARHLDAAGEHAGSARLRGELATVNPYSFYARPDVTPLSLDPVRTAPTPTDSRQSLGEWLTGVESRREQAYRGVLAALPGDQDDRASERAFARGKRFLDAGFEDWAERELESARTQSPQPAAAALRIARLYDEYAMPWRSVRLYERARGGIPWSERRELADNFRYLTYPLPYPAQVLDAASRNDIAAHLVYALIREESRFDAEAVSRAGAVGLMQLMPGTARDVARRVELGSASASDLDNPEVNVALGTWYAADLLRDGKGSVAWMLAAYNAGPGAAGRWIDPGASGEDAIESVERIDYKETREYVKRVVESANVYHDLYFGGANAASGVR